jgi:hypothetical protein
VSSLQFVCVVLWQCGSGVIYIIPSLAPGRVNVWAASPSLPSSLPRRLPPPPAVPPPPPPPSPPPAPTPPPIHNAGGGPWCPSLVQSLRSGWDQFRTLPGGPGQGWSRPASSCLRSPAQPAWPPPPPPPPPSPPSRLASIISFVDLHHSRSPAASASGSKAPEHALNSAERTASPAHAPAQVLI